MCESRTRSDQSWGKNFYQVSWKPWGEEAKEGQARSPLHELAVDHVDRSTRSEELNDMLPGVKAALSSLEVYELAVRMPCRVPKFGPSRANPAIRRNISDNEVAMGKQLWDEFVIDLTDESLLCLSPSASVGSLSESDPPLPSTPKASPSPFEHFHLNSAATPFVPSRSSPITEFVFPSLNSPSTRDDDGYITIPAPVHKFSTKSPGKRRTSKTRALVDGLRLSPSPVPKTRNGHSIPSPPSTSSSTSEFSSFSEENNHSLADDDGWIVMEPDRGKPVKLAPSKSKSRRQAQMQPIEFPTLLASPAKVGAKDNEENEDGWIEWPSLNSPRSLPSKSRRSKTRSGVHSVNSGRGYSRQINMPVPPLPPHPSAYFFAQPPVYPNTPYVYHAPFQAYPTMVPAPIPVPLVALSVPTNNGWVLYPPA